MIKGNWPKTFNCIDADYHGKRFHYDGWRVENDGKSVVMKITMDDNTKGELYLPWEEIDKIRQFGWERQKDAAEEKMRGNEYIADIFAASMPSYQSAARLV